jgi:protein-disulfide isomerase
MTNGGSGDDRLSKNARREVARQKARALRETQKKRDRRSRFFLQGGLAVVVLAIFAVVALIIANSYLKPPTPGPLNMASDGITIGQNFKAVTTGALQPGQKPVAAASTGPNVINIRIYLDYQCPTCGTFEKTNAEQIATWVKSGAATIEVHPISFLDSQSLGQKYSTRAANAAACVANFSPNSFFEYNALLFENQPKEQTVGLTDPKLVALAKQAKVTHLSSIDSCIDKQTFKSWVNASTARATAGPIPGSNIQKVTQTPTIIVNGAKYTGSVKSANDFSQFVSAQAGNQFSEDPSPSPTPSSTATPSPSPTPTP